MLKVEKISKYYGNFKAVDQLSFTVKPGEIFGLLGINGAGKTTTFRMLMGLLNPDEGKITLNGKKIDYDITDQIGFLTEERSLLTKLTVQEQCLYYGTLKGMKRSQILVKMNELLDKFGIMEYKNKKIKELSKGNQQKIQFITAIINDPILLILDEPFSGLDPFNVELFENEIRELSKKGSMIIFSSHRMEHVELFCKKLVILVKGKSVIEGYLTDIKEQYRKKNIFIKGTINLSAIKKIKGVIQAKIVGEEYQIQIENDQYIKQVFEAISTSNDITKFSVEEPSLNEIFIEKVGESFES